MTDASHTASVTEVRTTDLIRLREFLESRTGMVLAPEMDRRLTEALRQVSIHDGREPAAWLDLLDSPGEEGRAAFDRILPYVSPSETYLLRDPAQYRVLREHLIGEMADGVIAGPLRVWSAGCSTGEEVWSLAIVLEEALGLRASLGWVLGTDIDPESLARGRSGLYGAHSFRGVPDRVRERYFLPEGRGWRVHPRFRNRVAFRRHNLFTDPLPDPGIGLAGVHIVLFRNVALYFRRPAVRRILEGIWGVLAPGGYLLVGSAEHGLEGLGRFERQELMGTFVYRKPAPASTAGPGNGGGPRISVPRLQERPTIPDPATAGPRGKRRGGVSLRSPLGEGKLLRDALNHFREKRYARAVELLGWLRREGRDRARASYWLGRITANRGLTDEAITFLEEALDDNPLHVEARYVLALLERDRGNEAEASAHLRKILFVDSTFLPARYALGRLFSDQGREREAARAFEEILDLLEGREDGEAVAGGDGMLVGQLRRAILRFLDPAGGGGGPDDPPLEVKP